MSCRVATFASTLSTPTATYDSRASQTPHTPRRSRTAREWRHASTAIAYPREPNKTQRTSERVFSLLEAMFGKTSDSALSDLIQGSLMLRYNKRNVG